MQDEFKQQKIKSSNQHHDTRRTTETWIRGTMMRKQSEATESEKGENQPPQGRRRMGEARHRTQNTPTTQPPERPPEPPTRSARPKQQTRDPKREAPNTKRETPNRPPARDPKPNKKGSLQRGRRQRAKPLKFSLKVPYSQSLSSSGAYGQAHAAKGTDRPMDTQWVNGYQSDSQTHIRQTSRK